MPHVEPSARVGQLKPRQSNLPLRRQMASTVEGAKHYLRKAHVSPQELTARGGDIIRAYPYQALAIGLTSGFVLGKLLQAWRRRNGRTP